MIVTAVLFVRDLVHFVALACSSNRRLAAENLFLRKQLAFYVDRKAGATQMYVFTAGPPNHEGLPDVLQVASTREGRLAMLGALKRVESGSVATPDPAKGNAARRSWPRSDGKGGAR